MCMLCADTLDNSHCVSADTFLWSGDISHHSLPQLVTAGSANSLCNRKIQSTTLFGQLIYQIFLKYRLCNNKV